MEISNVDSLKNRVRDMSPWKLLFGFVVAPTLATGRYLLESYYSKSGLHTYDFVVAAMVWLAISTAVFFGFRRGLKLRSSRSNPNNNSKGAA